MNNEVRLIDANALNFDNTGFDTYNDYSFTLDLIEDAPTIEAEPMRHGKWYHDREGYARCSNCNEHELNGDAIFFMYCPNCGAKMDGDTHD